MWTARRAAIILGALIALIVAPYIITNLWEDLDAKDVMVIQAPLSGELACYVDQGVKWQGFGKVTTYPKRDTYFFDPDKDKGSKPKLLQFNDGGHGDLYGAISWEMPLTCPQMVAIHQKFNSTVGVRTAAVGQMLDAAIYLAGPLMSSTESSGERRSELVQYINDQAENGVYVTRVVEKDVVDVLTQQKSRKAVTELVVDANGQPKRRQGSILQEFHIRLLPMSVRLLDYDKIVKDQVAKRQAAITEVQLSAADALKADQKARTAESEGRANAAKAQWEQETIKAKVVTEAQQRLEIAVLDAKAAEQYKRQQILIGEGDGERRRLVMVADGALDKKLETYLAAQETWSKAFSVYAGPMVPGVVMGGSSGNTSALGNAQTLMELISVKAAKDLSLDMGMVGKTNAAPARK